MSSTPYAAAFGQILNGGANRVAIDIQLSPNISAADHLTLRLTTVDSVANVVVNTDYAMTLSNNSAGTHYIAMDQTFYDFFDLTNAEYYNTEVWATYLNGRAVKLAAAQILDNGRIIDTVGDPTAGIPLLAGNTTLTRNNYFFAAPGA